MPVTPALTADETGVLIREAAAAAAEAAVEGTARRILRDMVAVSPMLGAADPKKTEAQYDIYALDQPLQWSTPNPPQRRPGSMVSVAVLRQMADNYDVLRSCINHLKREVSAVPIQIVAKDPADKRKSTVKLAAEVTKFFEEPGGLGGAGRRRSQFESEVIEDLCVIGASCTFYAKSRSGDLMEVLAIDASTIRPRVDAYGFPGPGECAYEQWIYGALVQQYTRDEVRYDGIYPKTYTPYFMSPIEWLLNCVNSALRADEWNRRWLTDGNTPSTMIAIPGVSIQEAQNWVAYFDAIMSGDSQQRQKLKVVPEQTTVVQAVHSKDQDFQEFELWLLRRTCACMGVAPASIGFAGEQYKVSQSDSMKSTSQFGAGVILEFRQAMYNDILSRKGYGDRLTCQNVTAVEEAAAERATRNVALVGGGIKTINEARQDEGMDPIEGGDQPLVAGTVRSIGQILSAPMGDPNADPNTDPSQDDDGGDGKDPGDASGANSGRMVRAICSAITDIRTERLGSFRRLGGGREAEAAVSQTDAEMLRSLIPEESGPDLVRAAVAAVQRGVYLCRHAQTDRQAQGLMRGWSDDPLNKQGRNDADIVGKFLRAHDIAEIHRSDLARAKETAKRIKKAIGAPITETNQVYRDWSTGLLDLRSQDDVWPVIGEYVRNKPDADIPAGESFSTFVNRALPAVQARLARIPEVIGTQVVVTHSSVIRLAAAWIAAGGKTGGGIDADTFLSTDICDSCIFWIVAKPGGGFVGKMIDPLSDQGG
jgi:broad specificity phosphatase PhoE/phage portal protein BeeE